LEKFTMTRLTLLLAATLLALLAAHRASAAVPEADFTPLFDGESLAGWETLPGGQWEARDGVIVGTSKKTERRHGMLITERTFGDFILRVDFKVVTGNSGLYFRVEKVDGPVGVHGFQAEIDEGQSTGGLYETGGRAWVVQPSADEVKQFYNKDGWNTMIVRAVGRDVSVWVNGHQTADLKDDPGRTEGFIALQLHGGQDMHVEFKSIGIDEKSK
jgi:hypothetical protein